ncbi:MAG: pilus assembly protein [Propionibacteriaceae bacterium]|nr:pilus assembly protein [Propionibacteriaceae bacterium]
MAESVQWAILMPLVITCLIGIVGVCLWLSGRSAAQDAAFAGAESGAVFGADAGQAIAAATQVATASGLDDVEVQVESQDGQLVVEVSARVQTFLPNGVDPRVHGRATRPKEG